MNSELEINLKQLQNLALGDEDVRLQYLATRSAQDPYLAFCDLCNRLGYPVSVGELLSLGEEMNGELLRAQNGGGSFGLDGWDDPYELFFSAIERT